MKKKFNRGFSFVELLAAIVIMGLLSGLAIVSIRFLLNKAEKEYYKAQESEIIMAAKSYTQDNRNHLPKRVGLKTQIFLSTLQEKKYIGDVVDRSKKKCFPDQSYVQVYRYDKNHYSYVVDLVCDRYKSTDNEDSDITSKPTIKINFLNVSKTDKYSDAKVRVTIEDDHKISSYSYIIMRDNEEIKNSGDIDGKLKEKLTVDIPLKDYVPGKITVKVVATNTLGNQGNAKDSVTVKNETAPTCEVIRDNSVKDVNGNPTCEGRWIKDPTQATVEAQVKCIDKSGSGCQKDVYTQKFFGERKTDFISMADNTGNTAPCEVYVCIDVTKPTTPVIDNPYEGIWINKSYSIKISSYDKTAGIAYFEYRYPDSTGVDGNGVSEKEWHQWANSSKNPGDTTPFVTTPFSKERDEYVEVRACDRAGNCSDIARSKIRIDKTDPTCTVTRNIAQPNGNNGWYKTNVTLTINRNDVKGSGDRAVNSPVSYGVYATKSENYDNIASKVQGDTKGITWYGFVKDEAGNKSTCNSESFKVDTTAPTCSISKSGTAGSDNWYRSDVSLSWNSKSDDMSGIAEYGLSSSSSVTYNSETSGSRSYETGSDKVTWYGFVKDKAGNTNSCSTTFGIDKTAPTVTTDDLSTSTKWCSRANKKITVSCSDSGSGVSSSTITDMGTTSSKSDVLASPRNGKATIYTCTDKAGNSNSKSKYFKVVTASCTKYKRYYKKCAISTENCKQKATRASCSECKTSKSCCKSRGCSMSGGSNSHCAGTSSKYVCPKYWTKDGKECTLTTQTCPVGTFDSYNYAFIDKVEFDVTSCSVNPKFGCTARNKDGEYTTECECKNWNCVD